MAFNFRAHFLKNKIFVLSSMQFSFLTDEGKYLTLTVH